MSPPMGAARAGIAGARRVSDLPNSVIIDDFNDENITEYTVDSGSYGTTTSNVVEGAAALSGSSGNNDALYSLSGDGLDNYPDLSKTIRFLVRGTSHGLFYNVNSSGDGYTANLRAGNNEIEIRDYTSGSSLLNSTAVTINATTWYWGEVDPVASGESSTTFTLYEFNESDFSRGSELASLTANDSTYATETGIGGYTAVGNSGEACLDWINQPP